MIGRYLSSIFIISLLGLSGCATVEYSVVIVQASQAISAAEAAGAACTESQLNSLSQLTRTSSAPLTVTSPNTWG